MVLGVKFLSASRDSSALEGHCRDLVLGKTAIAARITILYGNKRWAKLYQPSIDRLGGSLKAEKAACGILNRSDYAIVLGVHILLFPKIIEVPYGFVQCFLNKKFVRDLFVVLVRLIDPIF